MTEQAKLTVLPKRKQKNAHMEELFTDLLTDRGSNPVFAVTGGGWLGEFSVSMLGPRFVLSLKKCGAVLATFLFYASPVSGHSIDFPNPV